jgi:hypothetical protein
LTLCFGSCWLTAGFFLWLERLLDDQQQVSGRRDTREGLQTYSHGSPRNVFTALVLEGINTASILFDEPQSQSWSFLLLLYLWLSTLLAVWACMRWRSRMNGIWYGLVWYGMVPYGTSIGRYKMI